MTFKYDKDNLYKEFAVVKNKDIALSKEKTQDAKENDYFTNRVIWCDEHSKLQKEHPEYYDFVDIKFDKFSEVRNDHFFEIQTKLMPLVEYSN